MIGSMHIWRHTRLDFVGGDLVWNCWDCLLVGVEDISGTAVVGDVDAKLLTCAT